LGWDEPDCLTASCLNARRHGCTRDTSSSTPFAIFAALEVPLVLDAALMRKDDLLDDVETEAEAVIPDRRTAVAAASVTL